MKQSQEPKYDVDLNGQIINRATGKTIPSDEPVMIFRAQDRRAVTALKAYYVSCNLPDHRAVVASRIADFERFAKDHPERMKEPDSNLQELASANLTGTNPKGGTECAA